MVLLTSTQNKLDMEIPDFQLLDTQDKNWSPKQAMGKNGLLIMFICNHCPYVKSILPDLIKTCSVLKEKNDFNTLAIMSNDWTEYVEDSPKEMHKLAIEKNFSFPYLIDNQQEVARLYNVVCTPEFFAFNSDGKLQYNGRFDARGKDNTIKKNNPLDNELYTAILEIIETNKGPQNQLNSIGCSIKWRAENN